MRGIEKAFTASGGSRRVLDGTDLAVERGEIVAVAGRSGSGKTTLLTIVTGWEQPDAGTVVVLGSPAAPDTLSWRDLAIVPQSLGLLDELTVLENITLPGRLGGGSGSEVPAALMGRLGLEGLADRFPSEISLGEQQRTALARAAVVQPALLLADEPIAHQNRAWAEEMMALLVDLAATGTASLLATHNEIAFDSADRILQLDAGRLHLLER